MENQEGQAIGPEKEKRKGSKILLIILLLLLLITAGVGGFLWWRSQQNTDALTQYYFDKFAQDGMLEGKTPEEIQGILNQIVEEGMFNVAISSEIRFEDGTSEGTLGYENIEANHYYARVTLRKDDDGTVLYQSDGIKPGQFIENIRLSEDLPQGQYDCTARIVTTDPETLQDIGQVEVAVKVIVFN